MYIPSVMISLISDKDDLLLKVKFCSIVLMIYNKDLKESLKSKMTLW